MREKASFWCLIVNFEHISHHVLVFLLLTLSSQMQARYLKETIYGKYCVCTMDLVFASSLIH